MLFSLAVTTFLFSLAGSTPISDLDQRVPVTTNASAFLEDGLRLMVRRVY